MKQVVLVTGGTQGIGLGLAEAFLRRGDSVAVCGRSQAALDMFSSAHPEALAVRADVTNARDRTDMLEAVAAQFGRLDVLINNAGVFIERDFAAGLNPTDGLDQEVAINLTGPIHLTDAVLKRWPQITSIVFVTSGFALVAPTRAPTYGAAKAGLHAYAEALRRQLAHKGTHVMELLPPAVDTQMNATFQGKKMSTEELAATTLNALSLRQTMALPGSTKMLPFLLRLAPRTVSKMVASM